MWKLIQAARQICKPDIMGFAPHSESAFGPFLGRESGSKNLYYKKMKRKV